MEIRWTGKARSDLTRLYDFLAPVNQRAAARIVQALAAAPTRLAENLRVGVRLDEFDPREVRRIFVGDYELRYEIDAATIYVLRIWHAREER